MWYTGAMLRPKSATRIAIAGFAIDRILKYAAVRLPLPQEEGFFIGGGLGFKLHVNEFFAWSLPIPNAVVLWIVLGVIAALGCALYTKRAQPETAGPLWIMLAGAASNAIDRALYGGVVDYIAVPFGGIVNLADALVVLGAVLLVLPRSRYAH